MRFNPPPNWPTQPEGWTPPEDWRPDTAWGPPPNGWQLWVDDSVRTPQRMRRLWLLGAAVAVVAIAVLALYFLI